MGVLTIPDYSDYSSSSVCITANWMTEPRQDGARTLVPIHYKTGNFNKIMQVVSSQLSIYVLPNCFNPGSNTAVTGRCIHPRHNPWRSSQRV